MVLHLVLVVLHNDFTCCFSNNGIVIICVVSVFRNTVLEIAQIHTYVRNSWMHVVLVVTKQYKFCWWWQCCTCSVSDDLTTRAVTVMCSRTTAPTATTTRSGRG